VSNPSEGGWDTEVQLTAAVAEHGQSWEEGADWDRERLSVL